MMSSFYSCSIEMAFYLDDSSNPLCITSAVDDVMYIVNNLLPCALHTSQRVLVSKRFPPSAESYSQTLSA